MSNDETTLAALAACVGPDGLLTGSADTAPYLRDWTGRWPGAALAVARPRSTEEVAALVRAAAAHGLAIVPQGGNTGLVGGSAAPGARSLLLSLRRMDRVRGLDAATPALIAEAGCILADLQARAADAGLALPLGLGAEGSATIGGLVSTNAGGIRALRYGVTRSRVLGLEVVLPDGRVWDGLRTLAKNNMGYDLKHLFIGAEGTLGVITAVALALAPAWRQVETALVAVADPAMALALLGSVRQACGDVVVAAEYIPALGLALARQARGDAAPPLAGETGALLIELATPAADGLRAQVEAALADALAEGLATDGVLAESEAQRADLWRWREAVVDGQRLAGPAVRFDLAVPVGAVARFAAAAEAAVAALSPGCRPMAFGHIGDGNLHFTVFAPEPDAAAIVAAVRRLTLDHGGSICAEHGVGRAMRAAVAAAVGPVEHELLRAIKTALDPAGRMNPGVIM